MNAFLGAIVGLILLCLILYLIYYFLNRYEIIEGRRIPTDMGMKKFIRQLNSYDNYRFYPITGSDDNFNIEAGYVCLGEEDDKVALILLLKVASVIGGTTLITDKFTSKRECRFVSNGFKYVIDKNGIWLDLDKHVLNDGEYVPCFAWIDVKSKNLEYDESLSPISCSYCYQGGKNGNIILFNDMSNSKYFIYANAASSSSSDIISSSVSSSSTLTLQYSSNSGALAYISESGIYADGIGTFCGVFTGNDYNSISTKGNMICISY